MPVTDSTQADSEGLADGADKPPLDISDKPQNKASQRQSNLSVQVPPRAVVTSQKGPTLVTPAQGATYPSGPGAATRPRVNGATPTRSATASPIKVPKQAANGIAPLNGRLSYPNSPNLGPSSPKLSPSVIGDIRSSLDGLGLPLQPRSSSGSVTPSSVGSPGASESDTYASPFSSGPPSRALSTSKSAKHVSGSTVRAPTPPPPVQAPPSQTPSQPSRPPSLKSEDGGQKFNFRDLIGSSVKLSRKSSARSDASSRKSDSERSAAGESTASLLKKYGVCEKVAIGRGATSVVRLAHKWDRSEEKLYAVKEFRKRRKNETEKEYVKKLTAEFCISSTLHHTNIVETVDLVQDENQHWCEVMEYCPGGDLYAAIKKGGMSASEVECCFRQILDGLAYLHSQGVAHRDIKPENLFFDAHCHLKIGDYGASTVYRLPWETTVHMSTGLCGSEPYIAPEQFTAKAYDARLVDIWACGIVYYCLHFQELPWRVAQTSDPLYASYAQACAVPASNNANTWPTTINNLSPRACRSILRKMLEPDPKKRARIEDVIAHPWIQGIQVCTVARPATHVHVHAKACVEAHVRLPPNAN